MQILRGRRDVASAEPDPDRVAVEQHGRVAEHFIVPGFRAGEDIGKLLPVDAVGGARQAQPPILTSVAARVEHPVAAVRLPNGRLAHSLVEAAVGAALENRIGAELLPADAVSGSGEAEPLAPSAI